MAVVLIRKRYEDISICLSTARKKKGHMEHLIILQVNERTSSWTKLGNTGSETRRIFYIFISAKMVARRYRINQERMLLHVNSL